MNPSTPVLMIIFIFTFVPLIIAEIARNRSFSTLEDFFVESRNMPTPLFFFTVYATWVSSFAFLGASSYFYSKGPVYMTAIAWNALFGILLMVLGRKIWRFGKENNCITPTDFFTKAYHSKALSITITCTLLIFTIPYLQIQLSAGAYLIEIASGSMIPWRISGLIFYLIMIIYLWAGGLRAVAMADCFYGVIIFISMLLVGFHMTGKIGSIKELFTHIAENEPEKLVLGTSGNPTDMWLWISMFIIIPIGALMGPQLWIRAYAAKNSRVFKVMPLLLTITAIQYLGIMLAGNAGLVLYPNLKTPDTLMPLLLTNFAPPILSSFLFCGIAASCLSTANSQIHAISAIYTIDIHRKYINPDASDKKLVFIAKWAVLFSSAFAYLMLLGNPSLIVETGTIAMGGTAQIIIPTLGALLYKNPSALGALWGLLSGIVTLLSLTFLWGISASLSGVIALMINALVFAILHRHTSRQ